MSLIRASSHIHNDKPEPTHTMSKPPVSVLTVTRNGFFFSRLLVEKVRQFTTDRNYQIIVVDRGSTDATRSWMRAQPDVDFISFRQWRTRGHGHAEAAARGLEVARHEHIVLLDSDAHPVADDWLTLSLDKLDRQVRLAGAVFVDKHAGNPHGWYVHPHFMCFQRADFGRLIELRKLRGHATDTGEEATIRVLEQGFSIVKHPIQFAADFAVGHPRVPTLAGNVFHAWYVSRLESDESGVARETEGQVTRASYLLPLQDKLRAMYGLDY